MESKKRTASVPKKAVKDALKFMANAVTDPEMPPETRRKCAEAILSRVTEDGSSDAPQTVHVTYQVIE